MGVREEIIESYVWKVLEGNNMLWIDWIIGVEVVREVRLRYWCLEEGFWMIYLLFLLSF